MERIIRELAVGFVCLLSHGFWQGCKQLPEA
jgi:hypothetical protein